MATSIFVRDFFAHDPEIDTGINMRVIATIASAYFWKKTGFSLPPITVKNKTSAVFRPPTENRLPSDLTRPRSAAAAAYQSCHTQKGDGAWSWDRAHLN